MFTNLIYIWYMCINNVWQKIIYKGWYAIKPNQTMNMNKTFSKTYIISSLKLTLDYIVLCLLDSTCFIFAEDNFIRVTSLRDRKLIARNITIHLNQCREKMYQHPPWGEDCEADLYGRIAIKNPLLRNQNNIKRLQWVKVYKVLTIE